MNLHLSSSTRPSCFAGAWSLLQVVELLQYDTAVRAVRAHLTALLLLYAWATCPTRDTGPAQLTKRPEHFWTGDKVDQAAWDAVIAHALKREYEAHVFKVNTP